MYQSPEKKSASWESVMAKLPTMGLVRPPLFAPISTSIPAVSPGIAGPWKWAIVTESGPSSRPLKEIFQERRFVVLS